MARKSTAQIEQEMYEVLEQLITSHIGGGFYQSGCRPANSKAEDAVLTATYANASQIQAGRAKLNIYVPDIDCGIDAQPRTKQGYRSYRNWVMQSSTP